nr:hypothetical protein [Tanacetum cinerariifolium]
MNQTYFEPNPCYDSNYSSFDQPQTYSCALCGNAHQYGSDYLPRFSFQDLNMKLDRDGSLKELFKEMKSMFEEYRQREQAYKLSTHTLEPSRRNEDLNTIPEKESNEFIKSSVEDLIPIPSESEDTSGSESVCILPSCDDFSPIDVPEEKVVTFSNPLFYSNDDFISSDDKSLSDEDVSEDNVKIYLNPLFEFDDEYI